MNFQKEVLDKSHEIPVLVDFWAPWCGPCKFIGPILEELAEEQKDKWKLVKVNVDENQEVSSRYSIRGIPAIKLFNKGEIAGEFSGALPKGQIQKWLEDYIPDANKQKLSSILETETAIPDQDFINKLESFIQQNPNNTNAKVHLAKHLVFISPAKIDDLLEGITIGDESYDLAQHISHLKRFFTTDYSNHSDVENHLDDARFDIMESDLESGIEKIIKANIIDKNYAEDLPRLTAIALFEILGKTHPITQQYRRRFDMALY